jgi:adenine-specific DNA-methyltransferase
MKPLTANDPETRTPDVIVKNVEQLKALFPEAFTEGRVDFEVLKQLLGGLVDEREEKYGLNWHGKRRARQLALTPSTGTLRPCPAESVDWDTTRNLMIEGDNLEVLKLLQKSYSGKVKLIYIDPPYNTGKDFVYRRLAQGVGAGRGNDSDLPRQCLCGRRGQDQPHRNPPAERAGQRA